MDCNLFLAHEYLNGEHHPLVTRHTHEPAHHPNSGNIITSVAYTI